MKVSDFSVTVKAGTTATTEGKNENPMKKLNSKGKIDYPSWVGTEVPCNGCRRCCIRDMVRILPQDDPTQYNTVPHAALKGQRMLAHKDNGECFYLGPNGCTIHERRPQMCRDMDCRNLINMTYEEVRAHNIIPVWERGRELVKKLGYELPAILRTVSAQDMNK